MTKHLMNMTKEELRAGYEKGKVTDEEIEQHLFWKFHQSIKKAVKEHVENRVYGTAYYAVIQQSDVLESVEDIAQHEYQKLKDNETGNCRITK